MPTASLLAAIAQLEHRVDQLEHRAGAMRREEERRVLRLLARRGSLPASDGSETMTPAEICHCVGFAQGDVARALEALRRAGFVEWTSAAGAGRWRVTEAGLEEVDFWCSTMGWTR